MEEENKSYNGALFRREDCYVQATDMLICPVEDLTKQYRNLFADNNIVTSLVLLEDESVILYFVHGEDLIPEEVERNLEPSEAVKSLLDL